MAKYVIEDTTLTNMADAIREKTGGTKPITPSNFATEIEGIQSGGGDTTKEDGLIDGTLTSYSNDRVTTLRNYALYFTELTSLSLPNVTKIGQYGIRENTKLQELYIPNLITVDDYGLSANPFTSIDLPNLTTLGKSTFSNCENLEMVNIPKITELPGSCFYGCAKITDMDMFSKINTIGESCFYNCKGILRANFPEVKTVGSSAFRGCNSMTQFIAPKATSIKSSCFYDCTELKKVDLGEIRNLEQTHLFTNSGLETLILRQSTFVTVLSSSSPFNNTPIKNGTGYIYVPDDLVDSYKSATNWSTYANQIKPISELEGN